VLAAPPFDLVRILADSQRYGELTGGAFDVTVQPLWDLYARHFARPGASPDGPLAEAIAAAVARVGQDALEVTAARVRLGRPGMGVTLNGIGQGYVTDRIVELLRAGGVKHALVDMGEIRALGRHPDGGSWTVGLQDPRLRGQIAERIPLVDRAVATSGGYGTVFDPGGGRFNHIFEPTSGRTSWRWLSVSVETATATEADALSTAFTLMPAEGTARIVKILGLVAHFVHPDGTRLVQRA
jgi:FAD:protein FMN transferase